MLANPMNISTYINRNSDCFLELIPWLSIMDYKNLLFSIREVRNVNRKHKNYISGVLLKSNGFKIKGHLPDLLLCQAKKISKSMSIDSYFIYFAVEKDYVELVDSVISHPLYLQEFNGCSLFASFCGSIKCLKYFIKSYGSSMNSSQALVVACSHLQTESVKLLLGNFVFEKRVIKHCYDKLTHFDANSINIRNLIYLYVCMVYA